MVVEGVAQYLYTFRRWVGFARIKTILAQVHTCIGFMFNLKKNRIASVSWIEIITEVVKGTDGLVGNEAES
jgi:uncharacterized membrane protein YccF (DUF307 family)